LRAALEHFQVKWNSVFRAANPKHIARIFRKLEFVTPANADQGGAVALTGRQCCADGRRDRASFNGPGEQSFTDGQQFYVPVIQIMRASHVPVPAK